MTTAKRGVKNILPQAGSIDSDWKRFIAKYSIREPEVLLRRASMTLKDLSFLQLGISTTCNYDCPFCFNHYNPETGYYSRKILKTSEVRSFLERNSPINSLLFAVSGEPLLHPGFFEIMETAERCCEIVNVSTNGALLSGTVISRLKEFSIGNITLSVEAGDREMYERFRRNGSFANFLERAGRLCEEFQDRVWVTSVVSSENAESLLSLPKTLGTLGNIAGMTLMSVVVHPAHAASGFRPLKEDEKYRFLMKFIEQCEVAGITPTWSTAFIGYKTALKIYRETHGRYGGDPGRYLKPCYMPFQTFLVDPEGNFNFCCGFEPSYGDALNKPVAENFNHPNILKMRVMNAYRKFPRVCRNCCHMISGAGLEVNENDIEKHISPYRNVSLAQVGEHPPWPVVDEVPRGKRIALWSLGTMGRRLLEESFFGDDLVGVIDRDPEKKSMVSENLWFSTDRDLNPDLFDALFIATPTYWKDILKSFHRRFGESSKEIYVMGMGGTIYCNRK